MTKVIVNRKDIKQQLSPASLLSAASAEANLTDFGDDYFLEPFEKWCHAVAAEGEISPVGLMMLRANTIRMLVNRLRLADDLKKHPEILDEDVSNPIIVLGFPRTGSTKLQRMMSAHPDTQALYTWRLLNPAPFPNAQSDAADPRIQVAEEGLRQMKQMFPDWLAGHSAEALEADEEIFVMEMTFEVASYWRVRVPSFEAWCNQRPSDKVYEYTRLILQYLQWQEKGSGRPFIMKSPYHLGHLDMLFKYFPKATVVHCHRDPRIAMQSASRLLELFRRMSSDTVDPVVVAADQVAFCERSINANIAQRQELGNPERIVDVMYDDIVKRPLEVIRKIMVRHGMPLTPEAEASMLRWQDENPQHRYGKHVYSLERFGLSAENISQRFSAYVRYFNVTPEGI